MALPSLKGKRWAQLVVVALAMAMVATVGLVALMPARAAFIAMDVAPGKYTGATTYVPGEFMEITITSTPGDMYNLRILNFVSGTPSATILNQTVGTSGVRTISWQVPATWPDNTTYRVELRYSSGGGLLDSYPFDIQQFALSVRTDRLAYLPGDNVTISWAAVLLQNGTPASNGIGVLEVYSTGGVNLLSVPQYNFSVAQGAYVFALSTALAPGLRANVFAWFNDTAGLRHDTAGTQFRVGDLGVTVLIPFPPTYAPGSIVTVSIQTRVTGVPGNPTEPNIPVGVNVTDLTSGNSVPAYSKTGLVTDASGFLTYVFQLAATPTTGSYEISATATAHGVLSATSSVAFTVQTTASLSVELTLDKMQYMSGDTLTATALVFATGAPTLTYTWTVRDFSGNILASKAGGSSKYTYAIPATYQGFLEVGVEVNNGNGTTAQAFAGTTVAFGYLALNLDKSEFNAGDTVTATFSLQSNVITNPTYYWQVTDAGGTMVASGSTTGLTATYTTPNPASAAYTFTVTASQNGRAVQAQASASQVGGYFLTIGLDRPNYMPGDTMTISYSIAKRGSSVLPAQYSFYISLYGVAFKHVTTTSQSGTLTLTVPSGAPTGDMLLSVYETNTGAAVQNVVHIGAVNPLLTEVAGIPLYDILLTLLVVVLLLAVILLWRRTGMGPGPRAPVAGRPTPPPPPPSGPTQPSAAGPMNVSCKHCGASIEITTSKRPIEVMCPSCGETQVVQ
ncbi:MAG: hypothetical protein WC985_01085 [Thermoplasmata archaeon]